MVKRFEVNLLEEAILFLDSIDEKAREKIIYNIRKAQITNDPELLKKLNNDIWEFRTLFNKTHYRLFAFWDKSKFEETLVIATHGLVKKTRKTPKAEILKAESIRNNYLVNKIQ